MTQPKMPQLQGNPIWFDLATPDPDGAKAFYTGLFGWEWADVPMSGGNTYHMAIRNDANIAGMHSESETDFPDGAAKTWRNQVYVKDAVEICRRIEANGGAVISSPSNADGWGVTARVTTHEGAVFGLWQSLKGHGAEVFAEPGTVCWTEYHTHDLKSAKEFYAAVFDAGFEEMKVPADDGAGEVFTLTMLSIEGEQVPCAFAELADPSMPASWATYFMTEDIHASIEKAQSLDGELVLGVIDVPPGSLAALRDPQGVRFSLWQPAG